MLHHLALTGHNGLPNWIASNTPRNYTRFVGGNREERLVARRRVGHGILASSAEPLACLTTAEQHKVSILALHFNQVFVLLILQALVFLIDLRNYQLRLQMPRVVQRTLHKQSSS